MGAGRQTALVTLIVGEKHQRLWRTYCRDNWQAYADRHGYDLIVFDRPLDESPRAQARSPTWQKLLILGQPAVRRYEQVVWVDSDILINPLAPAVTDGVPLERVGAVDEYANPTREIYRRTLRTWYRLMEEHGDAFLRNETPLEFYRAAGIEDGFDEVVQAGVLVLSPRFHRGLLEHVHAAYENDPRPALGEMRVLSYELLRAGLMHWIDPRFNVMLSEYKLVRFPFLLTHPEHPLAAGCLVQALAESYFLHFAGVHEQISAVELAAKAPLPLRSWVPPPSPPEVSPAPCRAAVALILFNRVEKVARVLEAMRAVRPPRLFVIADGPRAGNPDDVRLCAEARAVLDRVDWPCEVHWNTAEANLGLKRRVETGLDWLFEQVDEAIILEDDVVPDPSFFAYCDELLERYRNDERVFSISGSDFRFGFGDSGASYSFSRYPLVWGWATWRRAWRQHDPSMSELPAALESGWLQQLLDDRWAADYWAWLLQQCRDEGHTWDYAWMFSSWRRGGLSIHPHLNLVSNIGFGAHATHTHDPVSIFADLERHRMVFPLRHPVAVTRDVEADRLVEMNAFGGNLLHLWMRLRARQRGRRRARQHG